MKITENCTKTYAEEGVSLTTYTNGRPPELHFAAGDRPRLLSEITLARLAAVLKAAGHAGVAPADGYHGFRPGQRVRKGVEEAVVIERLSSGFGADPYWVPVVHTSGRRAGSVNGWGHETMRAT